MQNMVTQNMEARDTAARNTAARGAKRALRTGMAAIFAFVALACAREPFPGGDDVEGVEVLARMSFAPEANVEVCTKATDRKSVV